jgi:hypothetical protein
VAEANDGLPSEPAGWPRVVGWISVGWASFWLLCGGCGLTWLALMPRFMAGAEQQMGEPMPDVMKPGMPQLVIGAVSMISPILLMTAGVLTLRRNAAGRGMHLLYSFVALVILAVNAVFGIQQQLALMEWAKHNGSSKWAQRSGGPTGLIITVCILTIGMVWPLFCMIWFGMVKRDNRDLRGTEPSAII